MGVSQRKMLATVLAGTGKHRGQKSFEAPQREDTGEEAAGVLSSFLYFGKMARESYLELLHG